MLVEFHQIYNFGAVRDEGEPIRFWGQKVKGQGHSTFLVVADWSMVCHWRTSSYTFTRKLKTLFFSSCYV